MKNYRKIWQYLLYALFISLTLLILNVTNQLDLPKVVQDINSGVISAVLTSLITMTYLSIQNENEESKEKKTVIYEEKLEIFNKFLDVFSNAIKDGKLNNEDIRNIIFQHAAVRMHLTDQNRNSFDLLFSGIGPELLFVDENQNPNYVEFTLLINSICEIFRNELYEHVSSYRANKMSSYRYPDFSNFSNITGKPKRLILPASSIDDVKIFLDSANELISIGKDSIVTRFKPKKSISSDFVNTYKYISNIISEVQFENLNVDFDLKKTILDKQYCAIPHVRFFYFNKPFIDIYVSNRNRVVIDVYSGESFKSTPIDINDKEEITVEDISQLLSLHKIQIAFETLKKNFSNLNETG